jgi:glutamate racemase
LASSSQPIGVFDSGVGGLTVVRALAERLPAEALCYFADTAHVPYGPQPAARITAYVSDITDFLLGQGAKIIVVACNTATAASLHHLRERRPDVPFVGMEPAVKPAALATRTGKVGVLATQTTIASERYAGLMARFAQGVQVWQDPCLGLVPLIEAGCWDEPETEALLRDILGPMLAASVDTLVLGCTHYPLVAPLIRRIAGEGVTLIDPAPAVARRTEAILREQNALATLGTASPVHHFYASGATDVAERTLHHLFGRHLPVVHRELSTAYKEGK